MEIVIHSPHTALVAFGPSVLKIAASTNALSISELRFLGLAFTITSAVEVAHAAAQDATIVWRLLGLDSPFAKAGERL